MKPSHYLCTAALLLLAPSCGCVTGLLATPHEHFVRRPDIPVEGLIGSWESISSAEAIDQGSEKAEPMRIVRNADGQTLLDLGTEAYELLLVPYPNQAGRYLAELQQVRSGELDIKDGFSTIVVLSIESDTLSLWFINGVTLADAMRKDGRSGNFHHYMLISEIDADPLDIISTIEAHGSELLRTPIQLRAMDEPQDTDSGLKE
jgi:hypothetical protein